MDDLPPISRVEQLKGVDTAVAELAVDQDVVLRPDLSEVAVDADLPIPHPLVEACRALADAHGEVLCRGVAHDALAVQRTEPRPLGKHTANLLGVLVAHSVEQIVDHLDDRLFLRLCHRRGYRAEERHENQRRSQPRRKIPIHRTLRVRSCNIIRRTI